jgi:quercetin dioxygenase-like cupin family protein
MSIMLLYRFTEGVNRLTDEAGRSSREALTGKVAKLTDLVRYQEGSIVSKTIVEKKAGTVTLFAFDRGQRLSEHTAPFDALVCILDGEATVTISGESHQLKEGEAILMRANEPHVLEGRAKFKMMLTMIRS